MHLANNYAPLPVTIVKGDGSKVWDNQGRDYIDFHSGYSATGLGHSHPRLINALIKQAQKLAVTSRVVETEPVQAFTQKLAEITGLDKVLPGSGGAESVETAIKAIRKWGYDVKGIKPGKAKIVVAENNFHGRTTTITSFSSNKEYRKGYGPFTPGFRKFKFEDIEDLERQLKLGDVAGVLIEPIQGEAGIIIPNHDFMFEVRTLCDKYECLLVVDEIQSGLGRTGLMFAYMHSGIQPDGVIVGKTLGGGLLPVSAFVATTEVLDVITPGTHGSTFGGNPLACAVALEVLNMIEDENILDTVYTHGKYLRAKLSRLKKLDCVQDIRCIGLWAAIELKSEFSAHDVATKALKHGLLIKDTQRNSIRIAPPMNISLDELNHGIDMLIETLESITR